MSLIPIVGYADRFSAAPGETIEFKVSTATAERFSARLVRVVSGDPGPEGPGVIEHEVEANFAGDYDGRLKPVSLGSYMTAPAPTGLSSATLLATVYPTTPDVGIQGVITLGGLSLAIGPDGATAGAGSLGVAVGKPLVAARWYRIWARWDATTRTLAVGQTPVSPKFDSDDAGTAAIECAPPSLDAETVYVAAHLGDGGPGEEMEGHFNGRIEAPTIVGTALSRAEMADVGSGHDHGAIAARWDFSQQIGTPRAIDVGPYGFHGTLVNLPTRAVRSSAWDGSAFAWTHAPAHYAAVHFHDDDLYDCGWETDFSFTIPDDLKSGVYAARLESASGGREMVPFFVTPKPGKPQAKVCVLIPTFTYTVYANIARGNTNASMRARMKEWGTSPYSTDDHPQFALSTYNTHSDGSGISFSSRLRPIITMRSEVISYPDVRGSGVRHFPADSHLWYWLETMGHAFDVITDDELHERGLDAIRGYAAVLTTSHPEYHTRETLDGLTDYVNAGGHLMYLGGNGFYWKVARSAHYPAAIEIRRGEGGIRAWPSEPGEYYNAFDGEYGGLWRRNGRAPQVLAGIGFTSQGTHDGSHYRRTEASRDPSVSWMFDGIDGDVIGDHGLSGGGAAGFELDRTDVALGTPLNAVVVARSEGHDLDAFVPVPEDILTNLVSVNGEPFKDLIRAEIVYFETAAGGGVFSVGSITYCGSLPTNGCDNDVSKLTDNVLRRFVGDGG